jgi:hypothetical protein
MPGPAQLNNRKLREHIAYQGSACEYEDSSRQHTRYGRHFDVSSRRALGAPCYTIALSSDEVRRFR